MMGFRAWNLLADDYDYWRERLEAEYGDDEADRELVDDPDAELFPALEEVDA